MNRSIIIPSEPVLWSAGASSEAEEKEMNWRRNVRSSLGTAQPEEWQSIYLHFFVKSWLRGGHHFDSDNLVTPVLHGVYGESVRANSSSRRALTSWRAVIGQADAPFLLLDLFDSPLPDLERPGQPAVIDAIRQDHLPQESTKDPSEFAKWVKNSILGHTPSEDHRFAVHLTFGNATSDISRPEEKPIKPVIDCLWPLFGGQRGRPDDWKILVLQVDRQGCVPSNGCRVRVWRLDGTAATSAPAAPHRSPTQNPPTVARPTPAKKMTNYEKLDEAAKELGSPPAELHIQALLKEARARFPELKRCRDDSLAATMDYQTINIRGRTQWAGDFKRRARWNRHPAFLKTNPATYRRLSEGERRRFGELWQAGADLLKRPEYEAWEWENLRDSRVGGPPHA